VSRLLRLNQDASPDAVDPGSVASDAALFGATVGAGLLAGLFWAYQVSVVRGLADVGDDAYVAAFRAINRRIQNPWFLSVFLGTGPLILAAWALNRRQQRPVPALIAGSLALNGIAFGVTMVGNVPLNNALEARGDGPPIGRGEARARFEAPWNQLNLLRSAASAASFVALTLAARASGGRTT
jgi:uncharacterized membrane protein